MFDSILYRHGQTKGQPIDIGRILECCLFYNRVQLQLDYGSIYSLFALFDLGVLRELVESRRLRILVSPGFFGVQTETTNGLPLHRFIYGELRGNKDRKYRSKREAIEANLARNGINLRLDKKARDLFELVSIENAPKRVVSLTSSANGFAEFLSSDPVRQQHIIEHVLRSNGARSLPSSPRLDVTPLDGGQMLVAPNFNLADFLAPEQSIASLLTNIHRAQVELAFASHYSMEIQVERNTASLMRVLFGSIIHRSIQSAEQMELFQTHVFGGTYSFAEMVNTGVLSQPKAMQIISRSDQFANWLGGVQPDADLVDEYLKASVSDPPTAKERAARFATFSGTGLLMDLVLPAGLGAGLGIALGAIDTFVVEKLVRGWTPNLFIQETLQAKRLAERMKG